MKSNVAKVGGTEQGVAKGMNHYVGIRMANRTFPGGNLYPTDPKIMSFLKGVNIKAKAYAYFHDQNLQNIQNT
jgi:hypothetical protein